jgi:flagellar biosynthetic protein FlhB
MAEESFQEKTEQATPKRRQEAREKGNVPRSMEVNAAAVLIASAFAFLILGNFLYHRLFAITQFVLGHLAAFEVTEHNLQSLTAQAGLSFGIMVAPILGSILIAGVASNFMQSGVTFSLQAIQPKLEKLNPLAGLKRIFSLRSTLELIKNLIKLAVIGYVAYRIILGEFESFFELVNQDIGQIFAFIGKICFQLCIKVGTVFAVLAVLDFLYQKYDYEKNLRMTKQEVKEEFKQSEGDPLIKSRIRSIQRQMARRRMLKDVPSADVVITNPVHVAVALKYEPGKNSAPIVVAKGMRKIAEKIKEVARLHGVPIVEKPLLARMLFKSAEIGDEIPVNLYQVVAEILAHVYKTRN